MLAIKYNQAISEEPSLKAMEKEREGERERENFSRDRTFRSETPLGTNSLLFA